MPPSRPPRRRRRPPTARGPQSPASVAAAAAGECPWPSGRRHAAGGEGALEAWAVSKTEGHALLLAATSSRCGGMASRFRCSLPAPFWEWASRKLWERGCAFRRACLHIRQDLAMRSLPSQTVKGMVNLGRCYFMSKSPCLSKLASEGPAGTVRVVPHIFMCLPSSSCHFKPSNSSVRWTGV